MSYKKTFLQLPLNVQLNISIFLMVITTIFLVLFISEGISSTFIQYLKQTRKKFFLDMQQYIIESNIFFMNLCFLQYENLNKLFNYQYYVYLKDEDLIRFFYHDRPASFQTKNLIIVNKSELNKIPTTQYNPSEEDKKWYVYFYLNTNDESRIIPLIKSSSLTFLNQIKNIEKLRIPYYGNITLMQDYLIISTGNRALLTFNYTKILEVYNRFNGNMDLILDFVIERRNFNYNHYKKYFEDYDNIKLYFLDIMYTLIYDIFYNYTLIKDKNSKEDYIKKQAIYFQSIVYENDSTVFHDTWDTDFPRFQGQSTLISRYVDFLLFHFSSIIDTYSIPFLHESNTLLSKNLCYYFLLKQIININITTDKIINEFNNTFLDKIYEEINKKDIYNIDDCKIETYYSKDKGKQINVNNIFSEHYDLDYIYNTYIYLLRHNDQNTIIF